MTTSDITLSEEHRAMVAAIDAFADEHLREAYLADCDRMSRYPAAAMDALAAAGWAALCVPSSSGGEGATALDLVVAHEALARRSLAVAQAYYSLWVLGADVIARLGTSPQQAEWLPRIAKGQARVAFALTEPGSGSDAAALTTRAPRVGGSYVVNGQKVFITGAAVADRIITVVRTDSDAERHDGLTMLLVDPSAPGVSVRPLHKIGLHSLDLCEVFFADVHINPDDVLGPVGHAWQSLGPGLAKERLLLAAISVGAMRDVVERATKYALERSAFGRQIGGFQLIADKIVRMRVTLDAATALVRDVARRVDAGDPEAAAAASAAKLFCTESYVAATRDGVQVFGGYGFIDEYPIARHYRDAKYLEIGGGTSQVQTIVIARSMGLPL
jgi:alkylation response protein AidB-like acyl-CoA dehydrogenase